jgi:hypothetical protein
MVVTAVWRIPLWTVGLSSLASMCLSCSRYIGVRQQFHYDGGVACVEELLSGLDAGRIDADAQREDISWQFRDFPSSGFAVEVFPRRGELVVLSSHVVSSLGARNAIRRERIDLDEEERWTREIANKAWAECVGPSAPQVSCERSSPQTSSRSCMGSK